MQNVRVSRIKRDWNVDKLRETNGRSVSECWERELGILEISIPRSRVEKVSNIEIFCYFWDSKLLCRENKKKEREKKGNLRE